MILLTADWHIKLNQKNVPVAWSVNRYNELFSQIRTVEKQCDLHIIGGDIFDRLPTMEELNIYFSFVRSCTIPTIITDGNHEATKKNQTFLAYLQEVTEAINPLVTIVTTPTEYEKFSILPYCYLHRPKAIENMPDKPLFTHVRGEIAPHVKPEVDLSRFDRFPIVYAGDLHSHSNTQRNIVYPGSPVTTSFHRSEVETGYLLIDSENMLTWTWKAFDLPQLIRKTVKTEQEMVATDYHHTIYEIEGSLKDLAAVKNSELLDKKVVRRGKETALVINSDMSLQDELVEYLRYILDLDDKTISSVLGVYNDYITKAAVE